MTKSVKWEWEITSKTSWFVNFKELYFYKDLLLSQTRKDFLGAYQQTLLGPLWVLIQPLLTVGIFVIVFNNILGVKTDGYPPMLFNMIGVTLWTLFSDIFTNTSRTFTQNAAVFNKVYFPRVIVALSALLLQLLLFGVQLLLLGSVFTYYALTNQVTFHASTLPLALVAVVITSGIAFGAGLIFSVLTAKYRDLTSLTQLVIRLLMFVTPVFFTLSVVPQKVNWVVMLNPLSSMFELFRAAFTGTYHGTLNAITFSVLFMTIIVTAGVLLFNKMGDKLLDVL
ncbi:ABC transporter permease [Mucilaginibacter sp. CSA2-8R]|uniref:ABC transporter permease n=1 Tax=Mucilaginibacter sp. CSA2-8R TaxID=3141542 RepID=UPI00315CABEE